MLQASQPRNILLVFGVVIREQVATATVGNEVDLLGTRRIRRSFQ